MIYSAVIPTLNEERFIASAISSIKAQTIQPDEIIVVDGGSADATVDIANRLGARVIRSKIANVGYQRDLGVINARNNIILMSDGDTVLSPEFVEKSAKLLKPGVAVTGRFRPLNDSISARVNLAIRELIPIELRLPGILLFIKKDPWNMYFSQPLKGKWKDIQNFKREYRIVQGDGIIYTHIPVEQQFATGLLVGAVTTRLIQKMMR